MKNVLAAALLVSAFGCGDNSGTHTSETRGDIQILVPGSPADVTAIHVAVTAPDIVGSVDADLIKQVDDSWLGSVLDVPPGTSRTVTAEAFDVDLNNTFEGSASNVTVVAGELTDVSLTLHSADTDTGVNTPPHFTSLVYPASLVSTEAGTLFATAADPDTNTLLTYSWSVLQGGGVLSDATSSNLTPGTAASTVYTPVEGFSGFALIQVSASDGVASTTTTFPIAISEGVGTIVPHISFDVPPDVVIAGVERQSLMPRGTTQIQYALTNPAQSWTPATMHVVATWTDTCGGSFDAAPESLDINKGDTATRTVTYTASSDRPASVTSCGLELTVVNASNVTSRSRVATWIEPTMAMFQSSATVSGAMFGGSYEAADAFCQALADAPTAVAPSGNYHALIAFDAISTKDRLLDAPFVRVDGTPIARNKAELYSSDLLASVLTNEHNAFTGVSAVYTGTNGDGSKGTNCLNWTSSDGDDTSTAGINAAAVNPNWTNSGTFTCSASLPIYCVQQPNLSPI